MRTEPSSALSKKPKPSWCAGSISPRVLLFLMVPGDNESGAFYIYDRDRSSFYPLSLAIEGRYGGFREKEFESLTKAFDLVALAWNPRLLRA